MRVLVTGGTGYIGSHTCLELIEAGYELVAIDNLANSSAESLSRVEQLTGKAIPFHKMDIRNEADLFNVFEQYQITVVIHFAGLKAVRESVENPLAYYDNNVAGTVTLCEVMKAFNCKHIVFSSSATVYGTASTIPIKETAPLVPTNPYGHSKLMIENILSDVFASDDTWGIARLRYFNPIGAHNSGLLGEDPSGTPNNLMPYIAQVAAGKREKLKIFGGDYPTPDGTGIRDYIHVVDLAKGHIKAMETILQTPCQLTVNLGTGQGHSVLDIVDTFERVAKRPIRYEIVARRVGDVAESVADPTLAIESIGWQAERPIEQMCEDLWRWQSRNPNGYVK